MNLSAKVEYAAIAVLELAQQYLSGEPVRLRAIAEAHDIPSPFLVQILLQLKGAGVVESTRGCSGGYRLSRPPEKITLGEIKAVIEGAAGELTSNLSSSTPTSRLLLDAWREVDTTERERLASITFADLMERFRGRTEKMYYI